MVAGARTRPHYGGTLRAEIEGDPWQQPNGLARRLVYDGLTRMDSGGSAAPALAIDWKPENDRHRWQFRLRPAVHFSDGAPLTSVNVVASLNASCPRNCPWTAVRAVGASVVFTSDSPMPVLPAVLAGDAYLIALPNPNASSDDRLLGTGPYQTAGFASNVLKLTANENCCGNLVPTWSGTLTKATLTLATTDSGADLYVDKVSVTDASLPNSGYVLDRVVLSPASNPFGSTNPQGIYVIDCAGNSVTIGPCRIAGTLVLLNPGSNTAVAGPIVCEPAVAGFPTLMVNGPLAINFDKSVALSESTYGVNFNPSGSPYPYVGGTTNSGMTDSFPSAISGIVYAAGDMTFSGNPAITGNVVGGGATNVHGTSLNLTYSNASYNSPPPGFSANFPTVVALPGTWQRVTN